MPRTESAVIKAKRKPPDVSRDGIHFSRYLRHKFMDVSDIAAADGVTVDTIKKSIAIVDTYRSLHTMDFANEAAAQTILENQTVASSALRNGLTATTVKEVEDGGKKKKVQVPDHDTQQKALKNFTSLVEAIQPKGGKAITVNANAQAASVAPQQPVVRESHYVGFEDRVRSIHARIQSQNQLPSETGTTFDDDNLADDEESESEVES